MNERFLRPILYSPKKTSSFILNTSKRHHRDLTLVDWSSMVPESSFSYKKDRQKINNCALQWCSIHVWSKRSCTTSINKSFLVIKPITWDGRGTTNICLKPSWRKRLYTCTTKMNNYGKEYIHMRQSKQLGMKTEMKLQTFVKDISSGTM